MEDYKLESPLYIKLFSDLHLDFDVRTINAYHALWKIKKTEYDRDTLLCLAGDLWTSQKIFEYQNFSWIKDLSKSFKYVVIVLGNHDLWGGNIHDEYDNIRFLILEQELKNVFLLQNSYIDFKKFKICGGTLWTDLLNNDIKFIDSMPSMNLRDYELIKNKEEKNISINDVLSENYKTKNFIFNGIKKQNNEKLIVMTHHAPSYKSSLNVNLYNKEYFGLYYNNYDELILNSEIDFWFHGHVHKYLNYNIGNTNVICNPRGYTKQETGYKQNFLISTKDFKLYNY